MNHNAPQLQSMDTDAEALSEAKLNACTGDFSASEQVFQLDGLPGSSTPEFELEPDTLSDAVEPEQAQLFLSPQPSSEADPQFELEGMAKPIFALDVQVNNNERQQLTFQHANNLLDALEQQQVQVHYQCRDGYCGSCRCKKISGDVAYLKEPMAWINDDEILPCISVPKSDLILKING